MNKNKLIARNTKYLSFSNPIGTVVLSTVRGNFAIDSKTEIRLFLGNGYRGWQIYRPGCYLLTDVPAAAARQLGKYLKEVRQEADHDVCVIDFENISHE